MKKYICGMVFYIIIILLVFSKTGARIHPVIAKPGRYQDVSQENETPGYPKVRSTKLGELSIWSFYDLDMEVQDMIKKEFPEIDIEYKVIPSIELIQAYATAYCNDTLPDIFIMDTSLMGSFRFIDAFTDLAQPPYNAEAMISSYPENLKVYLRSSDDKKLIALPLEQNPYVTFYRSDAMKEAGFPSEPEELAAYMENMDNWLNIVKTFEKRKQYGVVWSSEPIIFASYSNNVFDHNLNFMRNSDVYIKALELGRTVDTLELASNANLMDVSDGNTIRTGETVMFQMGINFVKTLKEVAKGADYGQWRMTRLPFGLYSWIGSSVAAIPCESDNKEEAWAVLEMLSKPHLSQMSQIMRPDEITRIYSDPIFGEQDIDSLYRVLIERMPDYNLTPLDEKAKGIWFKEWSMERTDLSIPAGSLITKWSQTVIEQLDKDMDALEPYFDNQQQL